MPTGYVPLNLGTTDNDGTGYNPKEAGRELNRMLKELYDLLATRIPPAPVIGLATATGSTTATLVFTGSTGELASTITSYRVFSGNTLLLTLSSNLPAAGAQTTVTLTGLSPSTTYRFTVRAVNPEGISLPSEESNQITTAAQALAKRFFGTVSSTDPDTADILALAMDESAVRTKAGPLSFSNNFPCYAYPASLGDVTAFYLNGDRVFNQLPTLQKTTRSFTPPGASAPVLYNVYIGKDAYLPNTITLEFF